jgi:hypothetical protein
MMLLAPLFLHLIPRTNKNDVWPPDTHTTGALKNNTCTESPHATSKTLPAFTPPPHTHTRARDAFFDSLPGLFAKEEKKKRNATTITLAMFHVQVVHAG